MIPTSLPSTRPPSSPLSNVDTAGRDVQAHIVSDLSTDLLSDAVQTKLASLRAKGYDTVHRVEFSVGDRFSGIRTAQLVVSGDPVRIQQLAEAAELQLVEEGRWRSKKTSLTGAFFDTPPGTRPPASHNSRSKIRVRATSALADMTGSGKFVPLSTLVEWIGFPAGLIRAALACFPEIHENGTLVSTPPTFLMTGDPEDESSLGYALNPEWAAAVTDARIEKLTGE